MRRTFQVAVRKATRKKAAKQKATRKNAAPKKSAKKKAGKKTAKAATNKASLPAVSGRIWKKCVTMFGKLRKQASACSLRCPRRL